MPSPQGRVLASACQDNDKVHMHLWDMTSLTRVDHVCPGRVSLESEAGVERLSVPVASAPDGETVAVSEYEAILLARKGAKAPRLTGHTKDVTSIAYTPDGRCGGRWPWGEVLAGRRRGSNTLCPSLHACGIAASCARFHSCMLPAHPKQRQGCAPLHAYAGHLHSSPPPSAQHVL